MVGITVSPPQLHPQPLPEGDYRRTFPPELRGEILAQRFIAQSDYEPRLCRIIRKLERLMAAAVARKAG